MANYGRELKIVRAKHGLRQADLAKLSGLHPQTVVDIENDRLGIDRATFKRMLDVALGCEVQPVI